MNILNTLAAVFAPWFPNFRPRYAGGTPPRARRRRTIRRRRIIGIRVWGRWHRFRGPWEPFRGGCGSKRTVRVLGKRCQVEHGHLVHCKDWNHRARWWAGMVAQHGLAGATAAAARERDWALTFE